MIFRGNWYNIRRKCYCLLAVDIFGAAFCLKNVLSERVVDFQYLFLLYILLSVACMSLHVILFASANRTQLKCMAVFLSDKHCLCFLQSLSDIL